jgi:hypothetical protein
MANFLKKIQNFMYNGDVVPALDLKPNRGISPHQAVIYYQRSGL